MSQINPLKIVSLSTCKRLHKSSITPHMQNAIETSPQSTQSPPPGRPRKDGLPAGSPEAKKADADKLAAKQLRLQDRLQKRENLLRERVNCAQNHTQITSHNSDQSTDSHTLTNATQKRPRKKHSRRDNLPVLSHDVFDPEQTASLKRLLEGVFGNTSGRVRAWESVLTKTAAGGFWGQVSLDCGMSWPHVSGTLSNHPVLRDAYEAAVQCGRAIRAAHSPRRSTARTWTPCAQLQRTASTPAGAQ